MLNSSISTSILNSLVNGGTITPTGNTPIPILPITSIRFFPTNPFITTSQGTVSANFNPAVTNDNLYIYNTNLITVNITSNLTFFYTALLAANTDMLMVSKLSNPITVVAGQVLSIQPNEFTVSFINL